MLLQDYELGRLNMYGVIVRVTELLHSAPHLLQQFYVFLPWDAIMDGVNAPEEEQDMEEEDNSDHSTQLY